MDNLNIPFTVLCSISSALIRWYGAYSSIKKRTEEDAQKGAKLEAQVDYIYSNVSEIKEAINDSIADRRKLSEDVRVIKSEINTLEKRVEKLEEKIS